MACCPSLIWTACSLPRFPRLVLGKVPAAWSGKSLLTLPSSTGLRLQPIISALCSSALSASPCDTSKCRDSTSLNGTHWRINPWSLNIYPPIPTKQSLLLPLFPFSQHPLPNKTLLLQHPVWCSVPNTPILPNRPLWGAAACSKLPRGHLDLSGCMHQ